MKRVLSRVRVVELAQGFAWGAREWVAVLMIPAIFGIGFLTQAIGLGQTEAAIADTSFRIGCFALLCVMYRRMLAEHWRAFKSAKLFSAALVVLGAVAIQPVIGVTRSLLPQAVSTAGDAAPDAVLSDPLLLAFLYLGPLAIVMVEEFVFRHTLLVELPVWHSKAVAAFAILVNGVLFGLVHYFNFNGDIVQTVPYMVVGVFFSLVYLWTRNIWHVMLMHFLNNFVLTYASLAALVVLQAVS